VVRIIRFLNYFLMEKLHGPDTQLMDHSGAGPRWSLDRGSVITSPELGLMAALGRGDSPRWCNGEREAQGVHLGPHRGTGGGVVTGRWR
jgi:hypothetical protein